MEERENIVSEQLPLPPMSDELWKLILDRQHVPETLVHMLKGEVWEVREIIEDGSPVRKGSWVARGRSLMNDAGIRFFTPFIYSTVTMDKLTTKLTEEEVNRLVREMMSSVVTVIWERGDEFEIEAADRSYIVRMLEQNYFIGLTASRRGIMLDTINRGYHRDERVTVTPKKDGLMERFM